jgi:hypothetical protein
MNLKEAREIARKVGATIEERDSSDIDRAMNDRLREKTYIIRLGVVRIGPNGTRENVVLHATSPHEAADLAVLETGRACRALLEQAKSVYVDSDLIFGAPRS